MSMSTGLKNWHWRSKDTRPWAKTWFRNELQEVKTDKTRVVEVKDVDGDCDLGMRKSKLVTIYDLKITSVWEGTLSDGTVLRGNIIAVEVSHDMDEDEYVFETFFEDPSAWNAHTEAQALKQDAQKNLSKGLAARFQKFPKAMIDTHGKDLLAAAENDGSSTPGGSASGASTPAAAPAASTTGAAAAAPAQAASEKKAAPRSVKTAKVRTQGDFMISAEDLFDLLTNEQKVPSWSRNKATIKPEVGAEVSLFGGNITGKMTAVSAPGKFVQTWRAPTWPEGHFGQLTATLDQGSGSTTLHIDLEGVPVGKEDETEQGIEVYYIRSLKQIGLGSIL